MVFLFHVAAWFGGWTLARKMAAITLHIWKKGEPFDADYLKLHAA